MLFLRNVTFMTTDPPRLAEFWAAALGLPERVEHDGEIVLADTDWRYPCYATASPAYGRDSSRPYTSFRMETEQRHACHVN